MTIRLSSVLAIALASLLLSTASPAGAQDPYASAISATCVGGGIGCQQADFFLNFTGLEAQLSLDYFSFVLTSPGWIFSDPGTTEAEDLLGINFYTPTVTDGGTRLDGVFDFGAIMDPGSNVLRIRTEFTHDPDIFVDASSLALKYEAGAAGTRLTSGSLPTTVTPEPLSMILLGSGLAGIGMARRRRRRTAQPDTA